MINNDNKQAIEHLYRMQEIVVEQIGWNMPTDKQIGKLRFVYQLLEYYNRKGELYDERYTNKQNNGRNSRLL